MWTETDDEALWGIVLFFIIAPIALFVFFTESVLSFINNHFSVIFIICVGVPILLMIISIVIGKPPFGKSMLLLLIGIFAVTQLAFYLWYFEPIVMAMKADPTAGPIGKLFGGLWHGVVIVAWGAYGIINVLLTSASEVAISGFKRRGASADGSFPLIVGIIGWVINGVLVLLHI